MDASQCYEILGLRQDASHKEIKQAYREMSLRYHPDRNKDENAEKKFKEITQAYQILKQEQKKQNATHKNVETAQTEFWKYYDKKTDDEINVGYQAYRENLKRNFGENMEDLREEAEEKPGSHQSTHILSYGGHEAIAL